MSTTDNRPTDTIRDAFEAMLWFLACLIGPLRPRKITPAEEVGALAACEVETDFEPDEPPAPLLALRDLIQRAAEEHNRRALDDWHAREQAKLGAAFTPERMREARERCAEIDRRYQAGLESDSNREDLALTVLAIRAAREDLPAAIAEIERLNRLVVATANADPSWVERCTTQAAEIERLTAELAARAPVDAPSLARDRAVTRLLALGLDGQEVAHLLADAASIVAGRGRLTSPGALAILADYVAPADASLEARALGAAQAHQAAFGPPQIPYYTPEPWLAVVRAVDASRPAAPEIDAEDLWTDYRTGRGTVFASDRKAFLAGVAAGRRTVDASRPGLTEEQAPGPQALWAVAEGARHLRAIYGTHAHAGVVNEAADTLVQWMSLLAADAQRASRGETGPAPAGLTSAMHDAQQRRSEPPDPLALDPEDGTLCADCKTPRNGYHGALCSVRAGAKPGRVPDPRATLRAGDPLQCPGPNCKMCNGEACNKCGAGCWNNAAPYCAHSVDERHEPAIYSTEEPSR